MYATGPPPAGDPPVPGRLRISAMARRAFRGPPGIASRPDLRPRLREYLSDLVRPYGFPLHEGAGDGSGHSYGEMAAALIDELTSPDQPVDLVVLAFAIPDIRPGRATATYLSELCPGSPLAFAICDQGGAAAFTGLRLVAEYARSGGCPRALLLVVEQTALPYDSGLAVDVPTTHRAVALRCDQTGSATATVTSVRQHADVPPDRVARLFAEELAAAAGPGQVSLIVDEHLAGAVGDGVPVRVVPAGRPHTGGWWELAGALRGADHHWPSGRRLVLASYERQLRYLCLSTIDGGSAR